MEAVAARTKRGSGMTETMSGKPCTECQLLGYRTCDCLDPDSSLPQWGTCNECGVRVPDVKRWDRHYHPSWHGSSTITLDPEVTL